MALRAVGLDPALSRPVGQYSQGMRQRASLARVLQTDPELLLLDEPFSNLDVESAHHMVQLLLDFRTWPVESHPDNQVSAGSRARTIILTTHQAHLAAPLAETTLTMRAGTIVSTIHANSPAAGLNPIPSQPGSDR
jgi:ABC-type multidrug transport system ATPase subunit